MKKYIFSLVILVALLAVAVAVKAQVGTTPLQGWAWSSNTGWISFNSTDAGAGSSVTYNVSVGTGGQLSGYGWSSNVGWVSFNSADLSGCTGATPAVVSTSTGSVTGWARVVRGKDVDAGWDGCVKLSDSASTYPTVTTLNGTSVSSQGVSYNKDSKKLSGYAWGSDVLGWISFSPTLESNNVSCPTCGGGTTISLDFSADPMTVNSGGTTYLSWNSEGLENCNASGGWSGPKDIDGGESSDPLNVSTTFTLTCYQIGTSNTITKSVTVVVNTTNPDPGGSCYVPDNAKPCNPGEVDPITGSSTKLYNGGSCPAADSLLYCSYQCLDGYSLHGGECVWVGIDES